MAATGSHVRALGYCSKNPNYGELFILKTQSEKTDETAKVLPGLTWNCWYLCGFHIK